LAAAATGARRVGIRGADEGGDEVMQIIALLANEFEITRRELSKQCL
jgi:hypothetical protein